MNNIVIIGGSDAGISAALRIRELNPKIFPTLIVADSFILIFRSEPSPINKAELPVKMQLEALRNLPGRSVLNRLKFSIKWWPEPA